MWLLKTTSYKLHYFQGIVPVYAILSHTWDDDEVLFQDILDLESHGTGLVRQRALQRKQWPKIEQACKLAARSNYGWIWIDTCCIDKSSSADLSEAINSMFRWYREAEICYVHLADLKSDLPLHDNLGASKLAAFQNCRWWTRGWTLQELIAPQKVQFHSIAWAPVAQLSDVVATISKITNISIPILLHYDFIHELTIAERMSWASTRQTTRPEDQAYSLLGIFDVNMPLLYGEGIKAFIRLQEEILRGSTDLSLLAWETSGLDLIRSRNLLAPSPSVFRSRPAIVHASRETRHADLPLAVFGLTNAGLEITTGIVSLKTSDESLISLGCSYQGTPDLVIHMSLKSEHDGETDGEHTSNKPSVPRYYSVSLAPKLLLVNVNTATTCATPRPMTVLRTWRKTARKTKTGAFDIIHVETADFGINDALPLELWNRRAAIMRLGSESTMNNESLSSVIRLVNFRAQAEAEGWPTVRLGVHIKRVWEEDRKTSSHENWLHVGFLPMTETVFSTQAALHSLEQDAGGIEDRPKLLQEYHDFRTYRLNVSVSVIERMARVSIWRSEFQWSSDELGGSQAPPDIMASSSHSTLVHSRDDDLVTPLLRISVSESVHNEHLAQAPTVVGAERDDDDDRALLGKPKGSSSPISRRESTGVGRSGKGSLTFAMPELGSTTD